MKYFCSGFTAAVWSRNKSFVFRENNVFPIQYSEAVNAALGSFNRKPHRHPTAGAIFKVKWHRMIAKSYFNCRTWKIMWNAFPIYSKGENTKSSTRMYQQKALQFSAEDSQNPTFLILKIVHIAKTTAEQISIFCFRFPSQYEHRYLLSWYPFYRPRT